MAKRPAVVEELRHAIEMESRVFVHEFVRPETEQAEMPGQVESAAERVECVEEGLLHEIEDVISEVPCASPATHAESEADPSLAGRGPETDSELESEPEPVLEPKVQSEVELETVLWPDFGT